VRMLVRVLIITAVLIALWGIFLVGTVRKEK
jgi:hypothetical protein